MTLERDRWDKGLVRHLRIDDWAPATRGYAIRESHNGGLGVRGGSEDIFYTLVLNPVHEHRADELRQVVERSPHVGGVFSPERDIKPGSGETDAA